MITKPQPLFLGLVGLLSALAMLVPAVASADAGDPPTRVARLGLIAGSVSFQPAGTQDWVAPPINRPLTTGDQLWSDRDGRVELQLDGSFVRLSSNTSMAILNLGDRITQIQLSAGTIIVRVRRLADDETYEIDTPNLAFSVLRPGLYRLTVDQYGNTAIGVRSGQGEVTGGGMAYPIGVNDYDVFSGINELTVDLQSYGGYQDAFDTWSAGRDLRWDRSASARYVSPDVVGYEDLDDHGSWSSTPEYGNVWFPRGVEAGWAPYHDGHWAYVVPWGYTWVDDSAWGFAPFHYGRWVSLRGAWGWVPAPPQRVGAVYVRPVYAPALVAWVGVGAGVAWFALGPREVYVPSYPVSRNYVNNINVSNTTVNSTVVSNVYNTTIVNNTVVNTVYVNRSVPGAVVATTSQAFTGALPVKRNIMPVDPQAISNAHVEAFAPPAVPTRQAVLGPGRTVELKPPAVVQERPVVARTAPPPPAPTFERRQAAITDNGGKPLTVSQVRQIEPSAPARAEVKIAPPAKMVVPIPDANKPDRPDRADTAHARAGDVRSPVPAAAPLPPVPAAPVPAAPPARPMTQAVGPPAIHPNEMPPVPSPPSPSIANSVLERQHLQEQQRVVAQQAAERQQLQQQQEAEHQQIAKQQADRARQQQLEQQRQEQTQQMAQKHAQEQQQIQAQQADKARQQQMQAQQADRTRQQLEQQHQEQTQQMAQKHAQEQQQMQTKQQEEKRQQAIPPPPPRPRKDDRQPGGGKT